MCLGQVFSLDSVDDSQYIDIKFCLTPGTEKGSEIPECMKVIR